jgi:hypothetical protein
MGLVKYQQVTNEPDEKKEVYEDEDEINKRGKIS